MCVRVETPGFRVRETDPNSDSRHFLPVQHRKAPFTLVTDEHELRTSRGGYDE